MQDDTPNQSTEEKDPTADEVVAPSEQSDDDTRSDEDAIIEDKATDDAVDEIVSHEGDEVLNVEDEAREEADEDFDDEPSNFWSTAGLVLSLPFRTSVGRWLTFFAIVVIATVIGWIPTSRYWVLNTAGVRASSSITIDDASTQLALPNVRVAIAGRVAYTNTDGSVNLTNLRLGPEVVTVSRPGFATLTQPVTIGWGDNPLSNFALNAVGAHFTIQVNDYATGKPISGVVATSGDASALSDQNGAISLVLGDVSGATAPVSITMDGYTTATVTVNTTNPKAVTVNLVPTQRVVYVGLTNGAYDLYKSYVDGSDPVVLLPGSGDENPATMALATSSDGSYAALVSTRDTQTDTAGNSYDTLSLVNVTTGSTVTLAHAEQVQLLDWIGTRLIFEQVVESGTTTTTSIISYDYSSNSRVQLVSAPKLNVALTVQGVVYYAVAASSGIRPGFYSVNPDGGSFQTVYNQEVLGVLRTNYNTLLLQTDTGWLTYTAGADSATTTASPTSFVNPQYIDSPDGTQSLWMNNGVLTDHTIATNKDSAVRTAAGVSYPVEWLGDDAVVYRVTSPSGTFDYVGGVSGSVSHKIATVVNTSGFTIGQ